MSDKPLRIRNCDTGMLLKGVIFDLDGVLIDSYENHYKAFEKICRIYNSEFNEDIFKKCFGRANNDIFQYVLNISTDPKRLEFLSEEKEEYYREFARDDLKIMDGARELLQLLIDNSMKVALATSTSKANVDLFLESGSMKGTFAAIVYGTDVPAGKPEPDIFLEAANRLSLRPNQCLVIEDSVSGVKAAKNAKMKCIAITTTHNQKDLDEADCIVNSLKEIEIHWLV